MWKRKGILFVAAMLVAFAFFVGDAHAVLAKGDTYYLSASTRKYEYYQYDDSLLYEYTKITFKKKKVTFEGNILLIKKNGKTKAVKKLTLPMASKCKFYNSNGDGDLTSAKKKDKIEQYQNLNFYSLIVTVKNGEIVQLEDGYYD